MGNKRFLDDKTGKRYGRLVAVEYIEGKGKWLCRCDCGNVTEAKSYQLKAGLKRSCGCLQEELRRSTPTTATHLASKTRLYAVWSNMKQRCMNCSRPDYSNYGGRGISVCEEWLSFEPFQKWALSSGYDASAPIGECTLDRIDVNGDYEPSNCRWVDAKTQRANQRVKNYPTAMKRAVDLIAEDGVVLESFESLNEAARQTGCSSKSIGKVCRGERRMTKGMKWRYQLMS